MELPADRVSIKPGDEIKQLKISGGITTHGDDVRSFHVEGGLIQQVEIKGAVEANGKNAIALAVTDHGQTPLTNVAAVSKQGITVQIDKGNVTDRTGLKANGTMGNLAEKQQTGTAQMHNNR